MLTLFHPRSGEVRALPVEQATNAILHPWFQQELTALLDALPTLTPEEQTGWGRHWVDWGFPASAFADDQGPLVRLIMIWDNLAGHYTPEIVRWCSQHGILLLHTPLGGSWLNMAESIQRILVRRALSGQHPQNVEHIKDGLSATIRGWNANPTAFE